jgi:hypothetical protein
MDGDLQAILIESLSKVGAKFRSDFATQMNSLTKDRKDYDIAWISMALSWVDDAQRADVVKQTLTEIPEGANTLFVIKKLIEITKLNKKTAGNQDKRS